MPEAEDEDGAWIGDDLVDDPISLVNDLAHCHVVLLGNDTSHLWLGAKSESFVDESVGEGAGALGIVTRDERDNLP